jgi:hypothetical protein
MACNKELYRPNAPMQRTSINLNIARYSQSGLTSEIIKR